MPADVGLTLPFVETEPLLVLICVELPVTFPVRLPVNIALFHVEIEPVLSTHRYSVGATSTPPAHKDTNP